MTVVLAVLLGGVGAVARAEVTARMGVRVGTAAVNLAGAFLLGLLVGLAGGYGATGLSLTVLGVGFVDGLTAFSTWMLDVNSRDNEELPPTVVVTLLVGMALAGIGWFLGAAIR